MKVIIVEFAGRRPNVELQIPLVTRVLEQHPNVEWHLWNFARNDGDNLYLRTLANERISVFSQFYGKRLGGWRGMHRPFRYYSAPEFKDCLFVKMDDDIVFFEADRFADFVAAINGNRDCVISAKVINNGACTVIDKGLWAGYEKLDMPLLDVHIHASFAQMAHQYMFDNADDLIGEPIKLIPTQDWLSINMIGYDWRMNCEMSSKVGKQGPTHIAGRDWPIRNILGDEGFVNTVPRMIMQGFLACHLTFGPQEGPSIDQLPSWRKKYRDIGSRYLGQSYYEKHDPRSNPATDLATVCIPWRPAPERIAAHDRCVKFWKDNGYTVVEADSKESAGFLCTQARNNAVAMATTPIVIVADADTIPADIDQIHDAVQMVNSDSADVVWPFTEYRHIPNEWVEKDNLEHAPVQQFYNNSAGGILVARAKTLWSLGGFDERFTPGLSANGSCHGYDDTAFYAVAFTLCRIARIDGIVYSFNHATNAVGKPARDFGAANPNRALWRRFRFASGKPEVMRKLITPLNV